jgi:hypothetical protein
MEDKHHDLWYRYNEQFLEDIIQLLLHLYLIGKFIVFLNKEEEKNKPRFSLVNLLVIFVLIKRTIRSYELKSIGIELSAKRWDDDCDNIYKCVISSFSKNCSILKLI